MPEILFVCYGNICRSPMAEGLLRRMLDQRLGPAHAWSVSSAGVGAMDGTPAARQAGASMAARGIDLGRHRARFLTPAIARRADHIWCMDNEQVEQVRRMAGAPGKVGLLGKGVADPLGSDQAYFDRIADELERLLTPIADRIARGAFA